MRSKYTKLTRSWDELSNNLHNFAESEWNYNKSALWQYIPSSFPNTIHDYPTKSLALAMIPGIFYITIFNAFSFWQDVLQTKTLPWIHLPELERYFLHCNPHQIVSRVTSPYLDVLAAVPYIVHFLLVILFPPYVYWKGRKVGTLEPLIRVLWCAGIVCCITIITQLLLPTAPPWYNESAMYDVTGTLVAAAYNEAGFQRIDALIGVELFHEMYLKSPITFGSFPSMHVAFPMVILMQGSWLMAVWSVARMFD